MNEVDKLIAQYPDKRKFKAKYKGTDSQIETLLNKLVEATRSAFPAMKLYLTDTPDIRIQYQGTLCALFRFNKSRQPFITIHLWGIYHPINGTALEFALERNEQSDSKIRINTHSDISDALTYLRSAITTTTNIRLKTLKDDKTDESSNTKASSDYDREDAIEIENDNAEIGIQKDTKTSATEKLTLITSRRGQGLFRELVINRFGSEQCVITGASILLVASHIKPWADCNNDERLDPHNGLLLSPNYDKAFDYGYISFNDKGEIIFHKNFTDENVKCLSISREARISNLSSKNMLYLKYHREKYFEKQ